MTSHYHKHHPYRALMEERLLLSGVGSTKETYHLTLDIAGSGISYKGGDAVAIYPSHPPLLVEQMVEALHCRGEEGVIDPRTGELCTLRHFLTTKVNIATLTTASLSLLAMMSGRDEDRALLEAAITSKERSDQREKGRAYDLPLLLSQLHLTPSKVHKELQAWLGTLLPLLPRFYSIASAQRVVGDRLDLLVSLVGQPVGTEWRVGVGSGFLCREAQPYQTAIPLFLHPATHFTLPSEEETPLLMVATGTGLAPYRAFLQERYHLGRRGEHWLFFGERHSGCDFYYRDFFEMLTQEGFLHLRAVFSRDQPEKRYVQHALWEEREAVFSLIRRGAKIYICGDGAHMARDVLETLEKILVAVAPTTVEQAKEEMTMLRRSHHLVMDVY